MAEPIEAGENQAAPHLTIASRYKDPVTGALYLHTDLTEVVAPWEEEGHIGPKQANESFGDIESFASYLNKYAPAFAFVTWNSKGLHAVLDYSERSQWLASYPFQPTPEFRAWSMAATGQSIAHAKAVEFLDDHAPDILEPDPATLLNILRNLRSNVTATAETELRPDGTTTITFKKDARAVSGGNVDLPPEITIQVPVLKGHYDAQGLVRYKLVLKLRVSVGDDARLGLRFTMPAQERVLEEVYAERVAAVKLLLGDTFQVLRAAD